MSKILFSHSYYYKLDPKQWKNKTPFPPLGTLYAASLMRKKGFEVDLFDTNLLNSPNSIHPIIEASKPKCFIAKLLIMPCFFALFKASLKSFKILASLLPFVLLKSVFSSA